MAGRRRTLDDWLHRPSFEESVCDNPFHRTCLTVFGGNDQFNPFYADPALLETKVATLLAADLILLEGDAIFVREGTELHPLNEAISLLAYYLHTDSREARKAADILETNFMGYFPIVNDKVLRDHIDVTLPSGFEAIVDLRTLTPDDGFVNVHKFPEYGSSDASEENVEALRTFFTLVNQAIGDPYFAERTLLYPFNQPYREKSHILCGNGGNGKSMFMRIVQTLYGERAYTDAPQPNFRGHDAAVIAYSFIGKKVITFNDVGDPSSQFLEWMKRMITGNLEVKAPNGSWMSVPCQANFLMETNHKPQFLDIEAHKRRFIYREFDEGFKLASEMSAEQLDLIGERGHLTAGDIVAYLIDVKEDVDDWTKFD